MNDEDSINGSEKSEGKHLFDACLQARNLEIDLFWKRSVFFWGFIAVAFAGYATVRGSDIAIFIACFGALSSLAWVLVNLGSKWWQQNWEEKLHEAEKEFIGEVFASPRVTRRDLPLIGHSRYSVTKVTTILSYFSLVVWILIILSEVLADADLERLPRFDIGIQNLVAIVVTLIFAGFLLCFGRGHDHKGTNK